VGYPDLKRAAAFLIKNENKGFAAPEGQGIAWDLSFLA
jgi:hypothetical protein